MADEAPSRSAAKPCGAPLHQFSLPGEELVYAAPRGGQSGVQSGRAVSGGRLYRYQRSLPNERVLAFYNDRGTAEQHIKDGKYAIKWTRLSCMRFAANAVRLQLHGLAYNLANFLRTLATSTEIDTWSLTSLRERLIKTGALLVRHAPYAVFQLAEAALPRQVFASIVALINGLRGPSAPVVAA